MRIPFVESNASLNDPISPAVNTQLFTSGGAAFRETGKQLANITEQFKRLRDFREKTDAGNSLRDELSLIAGQAQQESDPSKIDEYRQKIDEAVAKSAGKITDNVVRMETQQDFNNTGYSAYASIAHGFRKKELDTAEMNFYQGIDQLERNYVSASEQDRPMLKQQADKMIDDSVAAGVFSKTDGYKKKEAQAKKFEERDLWFDVQYTPDLVEKNIAAGKYAHLGNEDKTKILNEAKNMKERKKKEAELIFKNNQIANESGLIDKVSQGQSVSIDDVSGMVATGAIRQETGQAIIQYMTSPMAVDPGSKEESFSKSVEGIFNAKDKESAHNVLIDALKGGKDGNVSQEELQLLFQVAGQRGKSLKKEIGLEPADTKERTKVIQDIYKLGSKQPGIDAGFNAIASWAKQAKVINPSGLYKGYLTNLKGGMEAGEAAQTAIKTEAIKLYPNAAAMEDVPNMVVGKDSPIRAIFPRETTVYPSRVWDGKQFNVNANREKKAGGK